MSEQKHCDQCENQCPVESLRCNRGRVHFGMEPVEPRFPAGPVGMMQKCGFLLRHGGIETETALAALSTQEQTELERLLSALLADWEKRVPADMPRHRHGHH